jgi:ATP-dependent protease ClpP protease subunit
MENIFTGLNGKNPTGTISGNIGTDMNPSEFAVNLREITSSGMTPKIVINSPGGSVFGGMEIIDAMIDSNVNTHIAGMAASMGGIISQFGKKRTANDFSMLMIHSARGAKDKSLLSKIDENLKAILMSRSKLSKVQLDDIFEKGKDVWFDASEMLALGLIDEIIETKVTVKNLDKSSKLSNLYASFNEAVNKLEDSFLEPNKTVKAITRLNDYEEMNSEFKEVKSQLGLDSSDTERDVLNSIKAKDTAIGDLTAEVELKNEEIERLNNSITSMNEKKGIDMVKQANADGKIKNEAVDGFIAFAKVDFEGCKAALDGIVVGEVRDSISNVISAKNTEESILERGYAKLASEDPEALKKIAEEKPELFNKLVDNYNLK